MDACHGCNCHEDDTIMSSMMLMMLTFSGQWVPGCMCPGCNCHEDAASMNNMMMVKLTLSGRLAHGCMCPVYHYHEDAASINNVMMMLMFSGQWAHGLCEAAGHNPTRCWHPNSSGHQGQSQNRLQL